MNNEARSDSGLTPSQQTLQATLAGFSFSALVAVAIVEGLSGTSLPLMTYYLMVSFLAYLSSINLQKYLTKEWVHQVDDTLTSIAFLSLVLAIVSAILIGDDNLLFKYVLAALAVMVWVGDHIVGLVASWRRLR
ncbi:MAG: hypothetical protein ACFB50_10810 [Rubrobacteraceae bacterium]